MNLSNNIVAKSIINATSNPFRYKDAKKFKSITKFIAKGKEGSSTYAYAEALAPITNTGSYTSDDIVGISVNGGGGQRRMRFDMEEIMLAIQARATIITDPAYHRNRPYNSGEREVADFLQAMHYREAQPGYWKPTH